MRGTGAQPRKKENSPARDVCVCTLPHAILWTQGGNTRKQPFLRGEPLVHPPLLPLPFLARSPPLRARALSALVVSRKGKGARVPSPFAFILGTRRFVTSSAPATGTHAYPPPAVSCAAPIVPRQSQSRTYEVQDTTALLGARGGPRQSSRPAASHCSVVVVSSRRCPARWLLAAARLRCCAWLMPSVAVAAARANISAGTDLLRAKQQFI